MKKIGFFLLGLCLACGVRAQEIKLQLLDKTNLQPITGAKVCFTNPSNQEVRLVTDKKGMANLNTPQGEITIIASGFQVIKVLPETLAQNATLYAVEEINSLNEVVMSASRFEESKRDVAQQVTILGKKEIAFMNQGNTADLLQQSGQVLIQKSQAGGGSPIVRGFEANKVLMVVDGIRMNNAIYRGGHLQNVITLDQAILDRTEIVFGPGSVMYGSDALGGVLHFHTKKPIFSKIDGLAYLRYASASSEKVGHASWNIASKRIAWVGGITRSMFGDLQTGNLRNDAYGNWGKRFKHAVRINGVDTEVPQENTNLQTGSGYNQIDALQKVAFKINDNITNTVNMQFSTTSNISRYDRLSEIRNGKLRFAEWYYGPQKRLLVANHLDWHNVGFADIAKLTLAYQAIEESRHDRRFGQDTIDRRTEQVKVYTANLDLSKQFKEHEFRYGAEFTHNDVQSSAIKENIKNGVVLPQTTRYPDGGSKMQSFAVYLTHTWEIGKKFITTQGLRYNNINLQSTFKTKTFYPFDDIASQNNQAVNGNLGFIFLPAKEWRIAFSGATGFRSANIDDMSRVFDSFTGTDAVNGTLVVPNPNIKPEKTTNIELSVRNKFFEMLTLEVVGYHNWYNDAIVIQPYLLNGQSTTLYNGFMANIVANQNARKAFIQGVYLQAVAELNEYVTFTSSITYTYGRVQDDKAGKIPLDHIPPLFGKSGFRINVKRLQTELFALYNGAKHLNNYASFVGNEDNLQYATPFGTPSWVTFNARASYQITPYLQVQTSLENVFDQHYRVFASGISGAGRNFVFTLRGSF